MTEEQINRLITDAMSALGLLERELRKSLSFFRKGIFVEAKAKQVTQKIADLVKRFAVVGTLKMQKDFASLSAQTQADVLWIEGLLNSLADCEVEVVKMKRIYKKPVDPQIKIILRHGKAYFAKVKTQPKGISILLKQLQKEEPIPGPEKDSIGFMPLVVLMWKTADDIMVGLKSRTKVAA